MMTVTRGMTSILAETLDSAQGLGPLLRLVDEYRRLAMRRRPLVPQRPPEDVAVLPWSSGELEAERQPVRVEATRHDHSGHADRIHPTGLAVRTAARRSGRRLVIRRHLCRRVNKAVEMPSIECRLVLRERL